MKKSKKDVSIDILCYGIGGMMYLLVLYYVVFISKGYYHSDCTDTIMWAQASYDAGAIMNPDFSYAAAIPFGGELIMLPLVRAFGVGIKAQVIGMSVFLGLFMLAMLFMLRTMRISGRWSSIIVFWVMVLLLSSDKLREIFWGHIIYYSLGVFFLMMGLGLILKCLNADTLKKQVSLCLPLFVWTVFASANGMQMLAICVFPILGAAIAERFFDFKTKLTDGKNFSRYILISVIILGIICGNILGRWVVGDIEALYASAYSTFSVSSGWVDNAMDIFPQFCLLIGVDTKNELLYSLEGISYLLRIACAAMLIVVPFIMAFLYGRFKEISYRIMVLVHFFLTAFILVGWIFGKLNSACWRLSPIVFTSAVLCMMFLRYILKNYDYKRLAAIILIPVICMFFMVTKDLFTMERQTDTNKGLNELAGFLEENGLEYGYATFWYANITTLLSDSDVKVRGVSIDRDGYSVRLYQTNENWYGNADLYGRYFLILSEVEYNDYYLGNEEAFGETEEILECGPYKILVYSQNLF